MKILEITVPTPDKLSEVLKEKGVKDEDIINVQYVTTYYNPTKEGYVVEQKYLVFVRG